jgi:predicted deacylase
MSRRQILSIVAAIACGVLSVIILAYYNWPLTPPPPVLDVPIPSNEAAPETPIKEASTSRQIGTSVEGRPITATTFGSGETELLFVGGIHGGYEWNSILLAYELIDHLTMNPELVPSSTRVTVIPNLNPDGLFIATNLEGRFTVAAITDFSMHETGSGRFNARGVDLNRNFDCKWEPTGSWRGKTVRAGSAPFSEPEAAALRDYVLVSKPAAVVFWHSRANTVYASECEQGILPETLALMNLYADAARYNAVERFDAYPVTGDAEGWLATQGIPAITVELETRTDMEWERNRAAIETMLMWYGE